MTSSTEDAQLQNLEKLLRNWSNSICDNTKDIVNSAVGKLNAENSVEGGVSILNDVRDRQSRVISTIQQAHNRQLESIKSAIAEERNEFARAQTVFEQSLTAKYEHSIDSLRDIIQHELDARLNKSLKHLETTARLEADRLKVAYDYEYEIEHRLQQRLQTIIHDLRKSWEEEEILRVQQMEIKIRQHYELIIEQLENQLKLALQLQDTADQQWLQDLELRNRQQLDMMKSFEEKCKKLYEIRLLEYAEKTSAQISSYEEKLLEVGSMLASEKNQFESRIRRMKLAACRWKVAYQQEVHQRYRDLTSTLDDRYTSEITALLTEIQDLKHQLEDTQKQIAQKEQEIHHLHLTYVPMGQGGGENGGTSGGSGGIEFPSTNVLKNEVMTKLDELKATPTERLDILTALLDHAASTPALVQLYDQIVTKLTARIPIVQLHNRKQFIEYKLKLASRSTGPAGSETNIAAGNAEKASLIAELTEIKNNLERSTKQYEKSFGEGFHPSNNLISGGTMASDILGNTIGLHPPQSSMSNRK